MISKSYTVQILQRVLNFLWLEAMTKANSADVSFSVEDIRHIEELIDDAIRLSSQIFEGGVFSEEVE